MQGLERENSLIKDHISRDIDTTRGNFEALDTFVMWTIAQKHTLCRSESKLALVVWT
jgi:hypothetical protein